MAQLSTMPASQRRFRYVRDPVFVAAVLLYFVNRWFVRPASGNPADFFHCYANDVLCIPFWLPPVLGLQRLLGVRRHDAPPTVGELVLHLILWSWLFEFAAPRLRSLFPHTVGDPWDVAAYAVGAVIGGVLWRSRFDPGVGVSESPAP